ncbi:MAG: hypothetical protein J0H73_12185 [Salana multivorans]|uniref:hypothetical protein n=1 Tax=Salana multivorans TaxID=120377 RepID=UPI00095E817F|nr:hypothetical protein [Salana multivorans]MBN8883059.1 hypothetical protein [Salana multivorans]OJX98333.1 MAG: hypothetical protein BGO96_03885 [Micrococcales bacterium 73-15]
MFLGTQNLRLTAPWNTEPAGSILNPWIGDTIDTVWPQTLAIRDGVLGGSTPQWNPYAAGGSPLASLPNAAPFSPLTVAGYLVPAWLMPAVVKVSEIIAISVGMSLFMRRLGVGHLGATIASVAYITSGFMIAWTNWPQTRVAALIPLLFWAVDGAVERRQLRFSLAVGAVLSGMLLGGFPAVTAYALYAVTAWGVVRLLSTRPGWTESLRGVSVTGLGYLLGLLLSAFQLLPFVDESLFGINFDLRRQTPQNHLDWTALATTLTPGIFDEPRVGSWAIGANPIENFSYLGAVPVVLALVALFAARGRTRWTVAFLWTLVVGSGVAVYVGGGALELLQKLPVFSSNPSPRLRVMIGFGIAVLAGIGASWLWTQQGALTRTWRAGRLHTLLAATLVVLTLAGLAIITRLALFAADADQIERARSATVLSALIVALVLLLVLLASLARPRWITITTSTLLCTLLTAQGVTTASAWWPFSDRESFYPQTTVHAYLSENLEGERYVGASAMMPGTSTAYGLRSVEGHAFHAPTWQASIEAVAPDAMRSPTYSLLSASDLEEWYDSPILDRLSTRYIVVPPGVAILGETSDAPEARGKITIAPGVEYRIDLPQDGPTLLRGITISFGTPIDTTTTVAVHDSSGNLVGSRIFTADTDIDGQHQIPIEDVLGGEVLTLSADQTISVMGADAAVIAGSITPGSFGAVNLVLADMSATIYERTTALPRIRWSDSVVVSDSDPSQALTVLEQLEPSQVLLHATGSGRVPIGDASAQLTVATDEPDAIEVQVTASGDGWLTVADAMQRTGWHVAIDEVPTDMEAADVAGVAVYVPAGEHRVTFRYVAPGQRTGTVLTLLGLALSSAIAIGAAIRSRRERTRTITALAGPHLAAVDPGGHPEHVPPPDGRE